MPHLHAQPQKRTKQMTEHSVTYRTTRTALMYLIMGAALFVGWLLINGLHTHSPGAWLFLGTIIGAVVIAPLWGWLTGIARG